MNMVHRNILTAFLILLSPMLPAEAGKEGAVPNCSQASEPELLLRGQLAMVRQLSQGLTTLRYDLKIPERHAQVTLTINNEILPLVAELRKLPPDELRQLCLLSAEAVLKGTVSAFFRCIPP